MKNMVGLSSEETSDSSHRQVVGYLKLRVIQAELNREQQDYFQTQLHFIRLMLGDKTVEETPVQEEAGLCPTWDYMLDAIPIVNK